MPILFALFVLLAACSSFSPAESVLPEALSWLEAEEAKLLPEGRPLDADENEIARKMGVAHPELVRILLLQNFPYPEDRRLAAEAKRVGFLNQSDIGRDMGYAILLKPARANEARLLAHELVHVAQVERLGREGFLREYLKELEEVGYDRSPLEIEARRLSDIYR